MNTRSLYRRISSRCSIDEITVRKVMTGFREEAEFQLLQGEEIRFRGLFRVFMKFAYGKFRLYIKTYPSFTRKIAVDFVENRDNAV